MAVNTETTLAEIIKQKHLFFELFDIMDARERDSRFSEKSSGANEYPAPLYHRLLRRSLADKPRNDARKVAEALELDNLDRNGLLIYFDKRASTFLLQPFVVDMLRHMDKARLKELTDSDLNGIRKQLHDILDMLESRRFVWFEHSNDYQESVAYAYETLRVISSRIKQNIDALHGQSQRLAELVDAKEHTRLSRAEQVKSALARIFEINERHIEPTLQFLDPNASDSDGRQSPMAVMQTILRRFEAQGRHEEYNQINRIHLNLLGSAERISQIRKSLSSYLHLFEEQRRIYNQIEARFNELLGRVKSLQDGRLSGMRIKASDTHFDAGKALHGIKDHRAAYSANIDWPNIPGRALLDEALRNRLDKLQATGSGSLSDVNSQDDPQARAARQRMAQLKQIAESITLEPHKDLYHQIHQVLKVQLPHYQLGDLLDAVAFTAGAEHWVKLPVRHELHYQDHTLRFFERQLPITTDDIQAR